MRQTLAGCALSAISGLSIAQATPSSLTIYGLLDVSYQYLQSGSKSPLTGNHLHRLADGAAYGPGSRLGFRVLEDLGDGLKATAVLEMGLNTDTGALANGGRAWGRQSYVSLASKAAGEIRLGRQYAFHDEVMRQTNPFSNTLVLNPGALNTFAIGGVPLFIDAPRVDNAIQYLSPTFNGFSVQAAVALGEGYVDRWHGVEGTYAAGAFNSAISYEWSKARTATAGVASAGDTVNKVLEIAANYDFKSFKVWAGYQRGQDLTAGSSGIITAPVAAGGVGTQVASWAIPTLPGGASRLTAYTVAVSMPVGSAVVGTNYTRTEYENATGVSRTLGRFGVGGLYYFSKSTMGFAALGLHNGDLKDFINEKRVLQVGLRKLF